MFSFAFLVMELSHANNYVKRLSKMGKPQELNIIRVATRAL